MFTEKEFNIILSDRKYICSDNWVNFSYDTKKMYVDCFYDYGSDIFTYNAYKFEDEVDLTDKQIEKIVSVCKQLSEEFKKGVVTDLRD